MAKLNITYQGTSADLPADIDEALGDDEIRKIAVEVVRSGDLPGLHIATIDDHAFEFFVVDRLQSPAGERRIYLRPKVPFG